MSASELQQAEWLDAGLWERLERLERLERQHRRAQWEHHLSQRDLQRVGRGEAHELQEAWQRYCEVIAELERATTAIEALRACASRSGELLP
jgi:hypothetical protein